MPMQEGMDWYRICHTVEEAAQTTTNAPTAFKPSQPLLVAKERKVKDSKTVLIHLVFVQTGPAVPISACWTMSKKTDTNASALLDTLPPQPIQRPTSSQNVLTLMNALTKQIVVMLMPHAVIMQAVTIAHGRTPATVNQD